MCFDHAKALNINLEFFQSNIEGEIVEKIQNSRNTRNGLIINAGGSTYLCSNSRCS